MQRATPLAPCTCDHCAPATSSIERLTLWIVVLALALFPGRAIVAGLLS